MENKLSFKPLQVQDELSLEDLKRLYLQYQDHLLVMAGDPCFFNPAALKTVLGKIESQIYQREQEIRRDQGQDELMDQNTDKEEASGSSTLKRSREAACLSSFMSSEDSAEKRLKFIHRASIDYENPQSGTSGLKFSNLSVRNDKSTSTTDDDD